MSFAFQQFVSEWRMNSYGREEKVQEFAQLYYAVVRRQRYFYCADSRRQFDAVG